MSLGRRTFLQAGALFGALLASGMRSVNLQAASNDEEVLKGGNGLYTQPWFEDGFLELGDEIKTAEADGKLLAIIYEQEGCPYCKELHKVNLRDPIIKEFMQKHFRVIQLDIRGDREVTDFSGKTYSEKEFCRVYQVNFTPTVSFFPPEASAVENKTGRETEAFRLTGYWKPFHFETVLRFVHSGSYKKDTLQNYLRDRLHELEKKGKQPKVWN